MSTPLKNVDDFEGFGHEVFGRRLSLFLDFDGTLAPIAPSPKLAELSAESREVLKRLSKLYPTAIITGRGYADIKEKVGIPGITFAANHGMEIRSEGFEMDYDIGAERRAELRAAALVLGDIEARYEGLVMEDKGATLSLHYRLLPDNLAAGFMKEIKRLLEPFKERELLRVTSGKKVIEVRPDVQWNKGRAVEWILGRGRFASTYPVYLGDDETDRDAFRAVNGIGASVYVNGQDIEPAAPHATFGMDGLLCADSPGSEALYHIEQGSVADFLSWLTEYGS